MNTITLTSGQTPISTSLLAAATALGTAADALFQAQNSTVDPLTGTGPTKTQTDYANELNLTVAALQKTAAEYAAQGS